MTRIEVPYMCVCVTVEVPYICICVTVEVPYMCICVTVEVPYMKTVYICDSRGTLHEDRVYL